MIEQKEILYNRNYKLNEMNEVASFIKALIVKGENNLLFTGDLGAGKTTLIKQLLLLLNVKEEVTSPTYTLVNEYRNTNNQSIYHMDLYRLNSMEEALEIGIEDMLYAQDLCLIEWPEVISPLLPKDCIHMHIGHSAMDSRSIIIKKL